MSSIFSCSSGYPVGFQLPPRGGGDGDGPSLRSAAAPPPPHCTRFLPTEQYRSRIWCKPQTDVVSKNFLADFPNPFFMDFRLDFPTVNRSEFRKCFPPNFAYRLRIERVAVMGGFSDWRGFIPRTRENSRIFFPSLLPRVVVSTSRAKPGWNTRQWLKKI